VRAVQSGVYWSYTGLIEGLITCIEKEFGLLMKVIATDGLAPVFADTSDAIGQVDPDITLAGIVENWLRGSGAEA